MSVQGPFGGGSSGTLAFTGTGFMIGGMAFSMAQVVVFAVLLFVVGAVFMLKSFLNSRGVTASGIIERLPRRKRGDHR